MKLFEELTQLHGVSGYETAVADYIKEKLAPLADDITTDPNGSVIAYFKGNIMQCTDIAVISVNPIDF